jgi:hypothetical protein
MEPHIVADNVKAYQVFCTFALYRRSNSSPKPYVS